MMKEKGQRNEIYRASHRSRKENNYSENVEKIWPGKGRKYNQQINRRKRRMKKTIISK